MHATTEQLLTLRDNQIVSVEVQQHVQSCTHCLQELQNIKTVQQRLQSLAALPIGKEAVIEAGWARVIERREKQCQQRARTIPRRRLAQFAVAASVVITLAALSPIVIDSHRSETQEQANQPVNTAYDDIEHSLQQALIQRNYFLEQALRELPQPPHVVRGGTASTIADLEDQIALVDYGLSYGQLEGMSDGGANGLLQNRADLLDSLYKVRYTQVVTSLAY